MDHCRVAVDRQLLAPLLTVFRNFDQEQGTEYLPQDLACNVQIQRQTNGDMGPELAGIRALAYGDQAPMRAGWRRIPRISRELTGPRRMNDIALYPLQFQPIYEYRPWGGRRLGHLLSAALPGDGPIGEAWVLSDREEHPSIVANGLLAGRTLPELLQQSPERLLGSHGGGGKRFPLLLKFLDVSKRLSVQVHPSDEHPEFLPGTDSGKDEAWVVIEHGPEARIYVGLQPNASEHVLRQAIANDSLPQQLASFAPEDGDSVFHSGRDGACVGRCRGV